MATKDEAVKATGTSVANDIATMDLYACLPEQAKARITDEIFDGPPGFCNADGTRAKIKMRKLTVDEIDEIVRRHRQRTLGQDKKGRAMVTNGRAVVDEETDKTALSADLLVEALVFPNLRSQEIQTAYGCLNPAHLVNKVFNTQEAFKYMVDLFNDLQFGGSEDNTFSALATQAKNS